MIDLGKLTPAPWEWWTSNSFRRLTGGDGKDGGVLSGVIQPSDHHPDILGGGTDMEFIVLARAAFDVMMRRGWTANRIDTQDGPQTAWHVDVGIRGQRTTSWPDPFTALCDADEWYKANVEEPANVTKETP